MKPPLQPKLPKLEVQSTSYCSEKSLKAPPFFILYLLSIAPIAEKV
jgi:hypothetical protein